MIGKLDLCRRLHCFRRAWRSLSSEIELLRQKKALQLRRKILLSQDKPQPSVVERPGIDAGEVVRRALSGRGVEVLETARRYYPREVGKLEKSLASLLESGRIKGPISGEELYGFLRRVGLVFSMDLKIRVKERGQLKTLEEKFREDKG